MAFEQAATVLHDNLSLTVFDAAHRTLEERWFTLGLSANGQLFAVSHTFARTSDVSAKVRLISARVATKQERRSYENEPR